jgi:hypothetical protein
MADKILSHVFPILPADNPMDAGLADTIHPGGRTNCRSISDATPDLPDILLGQLRSVDALTVHVIGWMPALLIHIVRIVGLRTPRHVRWIAARRIVTGMHGNRIWERRRTMGVLADHARNPVRPPAMPEFTVTEGGCRAHPGPTFVWAALRDARKHHAIKRTVSLVAIRLEKLSPTRGTDTNRIGLCHG